MRLKIKVATIAAVVVAGIATSTFAPTLASADEPADQPGQYTTTDDDCVQSLKAQAADEDTITKMCTITSEVVTSVREATPGEIANDGNLKNAAGVTLSEEAETKKVYARDWALTLCGKTHLFCEGQKGTSYFDHDYVWVKKRAGYGGYHKCGVNESGIGIDVEVKHCWVAFDPARQGAPHNFIDNSDTFSESAIVDGFPVSSTETFTARMTPDGDMFCIPGKYFKPGSQGCHK